MYKRASFNALYLGLSLLFATRFFPLHPTSACDIHCSTQEWTRVKFPDEQFVVMVTR